jgi:hypothetical protein
VTDAQEAIDGSYVTPAAIAAPTAIRRRDQVL